MTRIHILFVLFICFTGYSDGLNFCESSKYFNPFSSFRVIGGNVVNSGYNWMARLVSYEDDGQGILCGATVIDNCWLLTAAHCALQIRKRSYVTIRKPTTNKEMTFKVREAFVHPKYNNQTADNDIALLRINTDVTKYGVKPVCLVEDDSHLLRQYKSGIVVGYGLVLGEDSTGSFKLLNTASLQNTSVPIIPDDECYRTWTFLSLRSVKITPAQICAGSYLHGTAPGDSGGPLLIEKSNGDFVQIGITSYGADGLEGIVDQGKFPGVYTRVSKYTSWIKSVIENSSIRSSSSSTFTLFVSFLFIFTIW